MQLDADGAAQLREGGGGGEARGKGGLVGGLGVVVLFVYARSCPHAEGLARAS